MGAKAFRVYAKTNYGVELTEEQAAGYREAFFQAYPGLRRWHRSVGDRPEDTRTLADRRVLGVERFTEKREAYVRQDVEAYEAADRARVVKGLARRAGELGYRLGPVAAAGG